MSNRYQQLKGIWVDRENIWNYIRNENKENLKNYPENILKEYISYYITDKELSQKDLSEIYLKLHLQGFSEEYIDKSVSITKFLYQLLVDKILLPEYNEEKWKEAFFWELDEIIKRVNGKATKTLERINKNWFFNIAYQDISDIYDQFTFTWNIYTQTLKLDGIFGIWSIECTDWNFYIEIPVRIEEKAKIWRNSEVKWISMNKFNEALDEILSGKWSHKYFKEKIKWFNVCVDISKKFDDDSYFSKIKANYQVLEIWIGKKFTDSLEEKELKKILDATFEAAKKLINNLANKSGIEHKKRFLNYDSGYILEKVEETESEFEKYWISQSDAEKFEKNYKVKISEKTTLKDIGWQEKAKKEVDKIIKAIAHKDIMLSWWAETTSGIVFEWPSWTWKTLLAKAIASELDAEIYNIKLVDIASSAYINEWAWNVKKLFSFIKYKKSLTNKKIIVILDEMDALFPKRWGWNQSQEDTKIVNTFLTEMSGLDSIKDVIFIWTTNLIDNIDPAVVRSWRMTTKVKVDLPDEKWLEQIFEIHIWKVSQKSKKFKEKLKLNWMQEIAKKTVWLNWADVQEIVRSVVEEKALAEISWEKINEINENDFFAAIERLKKSKWSKQKIWF